MFRSQSRSVDGRFSLLLVDEGEYYFDEHAALRNIERLLHLGLLQRPSTHCSFGGVQGFLQTDRASRLLRQLLLEAMYNLLLLDQYLSGTSELRLQLTELLVRIVPHLCELKHLTDKRADLFPGLLKQLELSAECLTDHSRMYMLILPLL